MDIDNNSTSITKQGIKRIAFADEPEPETNNNYGMMIYTGGDAYPTKEMKYAKSIAYYINKIVSLQKKACENEPVKRYALYPILDDEGFKFYTKQESIIWSEQELNFVGDVKDYDNSNP